MKFQLIEKTKKDLAVLLVTIGIGILLYLYSTNAVFAKAFSLADGFRIQSVFVALSLIYKLFCIILAIRYLIVFGLTMKAKKWQLSAVYVFLLVASLLVFKELPFPKPMYLYEFEGFIAGIEENIGEQKLRAWFSNSMKNINNDESVNFERNDLSYLSKTEIMECEGFIRKYDSEYYELSLSWGNALSGHYGLLITNDPQILVYVKKNRDVVEVYDDIWAWVENK
jgi:hypothetical protein